MLRDFINFLDRLFPDPPYEGGYKYFIGGEWVWFPTRQRHREEHRILLARGTPRPHGISPAMDLLDAIEGGNSRA